MQNKTGANKNSAGSRMKKPSGNRSRRYSIRKKLLFSLIPVCLLLLASELFFRVSGLAKSPITPMTLPGERAGIYHFDKNLFWALKPNEQRKLQNVTVSTNSHGLRSDEIRAGEIHDGDPAGFRILSLGESTTFGHGVENQETYSAVLQSYLNSAFETDRFEVINAGVPAYSSFQSLMYLRTAGLDLKPNVIVFYHEINDYLPTYLRASDNTVIDMGLTDQKRFESRSRRFHRTMLSLSATYRFICYRIAFNKIQAMQQYQLPQQAAADGRDMWLVEVGDKVTPMEFPTRVSPEERERNFEQLLKFCQQHNIPLVVIHPTYHDSVRHECALTRFCRRHNVPMLEAYDALHPLGSKPAKYFLDGMHPTAVGHERLAQHLYRLLVEKHLVGNAEPTHVPFKKE
jgi:lysophospholipase L1-like esterase